MNTINWDVQNDTLTLNFRHIGTFAEVNRSSKSLTWTVGHLQGFSYRDAHDRPSRGFLSMHEVTKVGHNRFLLFDNEVDKWGFSQPNDKSAQRVHVAIPEITSGNGPSDSPPASNSQGNGTTGVNHTIAGLHPDFNGTRSVTADDGGTSQAKFAPTDDPAPPAIPQSGSCIIDLTVHPAHDPGANAVVQEHFRWCFSMISVAMGYAQPLPFGHYLGHNAMGHTTTILNTKGNEVWSMFAARGLTRNELQKQVR